MWTKGRETVILAELRDSSTKGKSRTSAGSWFEDLPAKRYSWEN